MLLIDGGICEASDKNLSQVSVKGNTIRYKKIPV